MNTGAGPGAHRSLRRVRRTAFPELARGRGAFEDAAVCLSERVGEPASTELFTPIMRIPSGRDDAARRRNDR
jgi:hypothetical protein